jgi:hypothetical protein
MHINIVEFGTPLGELFKKIAQPPRKPVWGHEYSRCSRHALENAVSNMLLATELVLRESKSDTPVLWS